MEVNFLQLLFLMNLEINEFSTTPPKIFVNGQLYGHLTENEFVTGKKIKPKGLKQWIKDNF